MKPFVLLCILEREGERGGEGEREGGERGRGEGERGGEMGE